MFYQLWVVHGVYQDAILPLAFFLLPGKSEAVYNRAFTLLKTATQQEIKQPTWNGPQKIVLDYELAKYNAYVEIFQGQVQGYFFYYLQAVYSNMYSFKALKSLVIQRVRQTAESSRLSLLLLSLSTPTSSRPCTLNLRETPSSSKTGWSSKSSSYTMRLSGLGLLVSQEEREEWRAPLTGAAMMQ